MCCGRAALRRSTRKLTTCATEKIMNPKRFVTALLIVSCGVFSASFVCAQEDKKPATKEAPAPRTKDGKKLLTAMDLMKIASVSAPRISPDGARVAYAVSEVKMEKDKEWKNV